MSLSTKHGAGKLNELLERAEKAEALLLEAQQRLTQQQSATQPAQPPPSPPSLTNSTVATELPAASLRQPANIRQRYKTYSLAFKLHVVKHKIKFLHFKYFFAFIHYFSL
jgi:hypothetical protein